MTYTKPLNSKGRVRKAGKTLAGRVDQGLTQEEARQIAANWRSAHAYPTWVIRAYLTTKVKSLSIKSTIASRTKKMPTIISKLSEGIISDLSSMQDIGGCRVVVDTLSDALTVADCLENGKTRTHEVIRKKDYFSAPKESGYRGVHLISKYNSAKKPEYKGMQVETQIRTRLVHNWATTIEAVDLMEGSMLKRSNGSDEWKLFFKLVSDHIARTEKANRVIKDKTPEEVDSNIRYLRSQLGVCEKLHSWESAAFIHDRFKGKLGKHFIVSLEDGKSTLRIFPNSEKAEDHYRQLEEDKKINAVSVAAENIDSVRSIYPNYFLDCKDFRKYVEHI